jgi:hypothetical protein
MRRCLDTVLDGLRRRLRQQSDRRTRPADHQLLDSLQFLYLSRIALLSQRRSLSAFVLPLTHKRRMTA